MQLPVQVTFRHMPTSPALDAKIRERAAELEQFYDPIVRCDVVVEQHHQRHQQGNIFHVRIHVTVPGNELVVSRDPDLNHAHEDPYVAVRDAFDAIRRQLEDCARLRGRRSKREKSRVGPPQGRITELSPEEDYGRIETDDGHEVYFHRNSVVNADFDRLEPGMPVRFSEEAGDDGPQASSVQVAKRQQPRG
jgi:ribosomal subunit interface protein